MSARRVDRDRMRGGVSSAPLAPPLFGDRPSRRGAGVWAFLLAIVTAGALAHVGVRIRGLQVGYDLGSERRIAGDLEEQRRRLQIEIGMLKDPGRVISIARDKLNMGPPAAEAILRLDAVALTDRATAAAIVGAGSAGNGPGPNVEPGAGGRAKAAPTGGGASAGGRVKSAGRGAAGRGAR